MSSIPSDAKKFDEFKVKFLFSIRPKTAEISPEKSVQWRIQAEKCTTTQLYTTDPRDLGGKRINEWVADSAVQKKIRKFLTRAEPEPKMAQLAVSGAQPTGKSFTTKQWYNGK